MTKFIYDSFVSTIVFICYYLLLGCTIANENGMVKKDILWEYCQEDSFSPRCNKDEVIIMESARYGHIQLSRCIDTDLGHFGCEADQLSLLDRKCSGRGSCDIPVPGLNNLMDNQLPCTSALARYLEAEYRCQRVYKLNGASCQASKTIHVKAHTQFLASITTQGTNCGIETTPWILEAKPGQQINISVIDFNWKEENDKNEISHPCPVRYGYIIDIDLNDAIDLCGGTSRQKHAHLSKGNSLQVIVNEDVLPEHQFLLSYKAVGCPTFTSPTNTWVKEGDEVITVGCNHNSNTWKMRCIGNNWIGISGSCDEELAKVTDVVKKDANNNLLLGMPQVVTFTIIGGVFLVIICVIVTIVIGMFCINNSKNTHTKDECYVSPVSYDGQTLQMTNIYPSYRPVNINPQENNHTILTTRRDGSVLPNHMDTANDSAFSPQYFVLEKPNQQQPEAIYDVVYQNM